MDSPRAWPVALRRLARADSRRKTAAAGTCGMGREAAGQPPRMDIGWYRSSARAAMRIGWLMEFLHSTRFALVDEQESCMQSAPECQDLVTTSQDQL